MRLPDLRHAYLFWLPSLFGIAGLHRFYLGKPFTGILFLATVGLGGLGTIYDALTMPQQVRKARLTMKLDDLLEDDEVPRRTRTPFVGSDRRPPSLEQAILRVAEERHGVVMPSRAALAAGVSPEQARTKLEALAMGGFCEMRVTRDGMIVYLFPDFLDEIGRQEIDSLT